MSVECLLPGNSTLESRRPAERVSVVEAGLPRRQVAGGQRRPSAGHPIGHAATDMSSSAGLGRGSLRACRVRPERQRGLRDDGCATESSTIIAEARSRRRRHAKRFRPRATQLLVERARERPQPVGHRRGDPASSLVNSLRDAHLADRLAMWRASAAHRVAEQVRQHDGEPAVDDLVGEREHLGVIPGISWMTTTPGPTPRRLHRIGHPAGGAGSLRLQRARSWPHRRPPASPRASPAVSTGAATHATGSRLEPECRMPVRAGRCEPPRFGRHVDRREWDQGCHRHTAGRPRHRGDGSLAFPPHGFSSNTRRGRQLRAPTPAGPDPVAHRAASQSPSGRRAPACDYGFGRERYVYFVHHVDRLFALHQVLRRSTRRGHVRAGDSDFDPFEGPAGDRCRSSCFSWLISSSGFSLPHRRPGVQQGPRQAFLAPVHAGGSKSPGAAGRPARRLRAPSVSSLALFGVGWSPSRQPDLRRARLGGSVGMLLGDRRHVPRREEMKSAPHRRASATTARREAMLTALAAPKAAQHHPRRRPCISARSSCSSRAKLARRGHRPHASDVSRRRFEQRATSAGVPYPAGRIPHVPAARHPTRAPTPSPLPTELSAATPPTSVAAGRQAEQRPGPDRGGNGLGRRTVRRQSVSRSRPPRYLVRGDSQWSRRSAGCRRAGEMRGASWASTASFAR